MMGELTKNAKKGLLGLISLCETDKWILLDSGLYINDSVVEVRKHSCDEDISKIMSGNIIYRGEPMLKPILSVFSYLESKGVHMTVHDFNKLNNFFEVPRLKENYITGQLYTL
jgi:hypothetical protein